MDVGVISGYDMTVEAAVMKLSYLLAKEDLSVDDRRRVGKYFNYFYDYSVENGYFDRNFTKLVILIVNTYW